MAKKLSFEEAMVRLQEIVSKLEKGEANLDESIKLFEEGAALSSVCYEKLKSAEQKINELAKPENLPEENNEF